MRSLRTNYANFEYIPASLNPSENTNIESLVREALRSNRNIIAIPLNDRNRHWTMLIINLEQNNFFYYDPMNKNASTENATGREMRNQIRKIIQQANRDSPNTEPLIELKFGHSIQRNGWECGFNILALLERYLINSTTNKFSVFKNDIDEVLDILKTLIQNNQNR